MPEDHQTETFATVVDAFQSTVETCRNNVSVVCGEDFLTYEQLDHRSDALAAQLLKAGAAPGDFIGISNERRLELAIGLLAILKVGGAYVPFDLSYPGNRLRGMAEDSGIKILLGSIAELTDPETEQIPFDQFADQCDFSFENPATGDSKAYVMYTSGSTGKPKGVVVPHRAILRLVKDQNYCELGPEQTILQHSPVSFDASTFEIWGSLLNGGKMVIFPDEELSLRSVGDAIREQKITTMWLTAGLFHALVDERPLDLKPLKQLLTGGDVVSPVQSAKILTTCPELSLINGYGPTENTTFTCCHPITLEELKDQSPIPIGTPINGTQVYLLDSNLQPVEDGTPGELCTSGEGLAIEYLNAPEITAERFTNLADGTRVYRTGDLASKRPDGIIDFHGRIDQQVKIRGFRIELGEIETAILTDQAIQQVSVVADSWGEATDKTLIAHYVSDDDITKENFVERLEAILPHYSIPSFFNRVSEIPLTPNGKVDRKSLPSLTEFIAKKDASETSQDSTQVSKIISDAFAEVLQVETIPLTVNFFDLGASSLQIARVHEKVQASLNREFPITDFFRFTTISALAAYLSHETDSTDAANKSKGSDNRNQDIAIIGLAGRFPGAENVDIFWENLINGKESISHFTAEELDFENALSSDQDATETYVRSRGIINQSDHFDAPHFAIPPREAEEMDPQHRLMLECAQTVLENAGHDPDRFDGKIGFYCGSSQNSYLLSNLCQNPDFAKKLAAGYPTNHFNALLGNDKDFLPTRVAYKLNLKGPAVSVQCACSTSLVSVAQACESLRSNTCDMALAGGISLGYPQKRDYLYTPDGIASEDGHCRTFDAKATGTVFGEGVGLVALRRLDNALADGDHIVAVIRGFAINNDGSGKAGYTAPSINGQVEVIREAQKAADVDPESIGYIEAHGTATPLGDPIEIAALNTAFGHSDQKYCKIGTAKTNVGHLDIAAGITGLIKTALTIQKAEIPPLLHFDTANPNIDFDSGPFTPVTELTKWNPKQHPRRAGVSAFGVGGTNVHLILEEAPTVPCTIEKCTGYSDESAPKPAYIFPVSASSDEALREGIQKLGQYANQTPGIDLDSIAYTLQYGRRNFDKRAVVVADSLSELVKGAESHRGKAIQAGAYHQVAFMFPGQGSQHPGMARELYETEETFRKAFDECVELVKKEIDIDLSKLVFPDSKNSGDAADKLKKTSLAQPAIFCVEYALALQWKHWGITPACLIGHSIGEFAAACFAGVFSLPDALKLICLRGKLMADLPGGAMISVRASQEEIAPFLNEDINLAAVNGATSCVIAGPYEAAAVVEKELQSAGLEAKRLHTSHAFHSSMMEPIVDTFKLEVEKLTLSAPTIPILSTVTSDWMSEETATDPDYWASHLRMPVNFHEGIKQIWKRSDHILLEVGPGRTLATLAGQNPDRKKAQPSLASLPHPSKAESSYHHIRTTLGELWCHGLPVDWNTLEHRTVKPRRVPLPTYSFQRQRYWADPKPPALSPATPTPFPFPNLLPNPTTPEMTSTKADLNDIETRLKEVLSELSGISPGDMENDASFLELGFDSLLLTQVGKEIQDTFKVKVSLRQLIDELSSIKELSNHLEANSDFATTVSEAPQPSPVGMPQPPAGMQPQAFPFNFQITPEMAAQMPIAYIPVIFPQQGVPQPVPTVQTPGSAPAKIEPKPETPVISEPTTVIDRSEPVESLTKAQQAHIDRLVFRYTEKTKGSKALTQKYRKFHADPRTASGFNRLWKEMVYQIVTTKSKGSRLLDVDGNEYIDILNGFGPGFLGHSTDFLVNAVEEQLHKGYEVGPQSLLALEAAELFCEVSGNERTSFVCTGSEAVQAAMRLARTVTNRDKIVIFARDYHGNFDEVLVRGVNQGDNLKSLPTAPGIPKASAGNIIVLPYGTDESLEIIRKQAHELAAVIVEPVQSRRPEFRPKHFIKEVREITHQSGTLFVFDEVVTGFRFGPRGAQEFYGVDADLCTYGKVIGGGMPLGVVSGKAQYMDTFDGGMWQYGDDSFPEQPVTFFAGTFVRHPLAMASVKAMLEFFKTQPLHFWNQINAKGDKLAGTIDSFFKSQNVPMEMPNCGSLMFVRMGEGQKYGNLFFYHLREKGVFMLEGFPSYLTAAHSDEDIDYIIEAFKESTYEMQSAGFFPESEEGKAFRSPSLSGPPPQLAGKESKKQTVSEPQREEKTFLKPLEVETTEPQREIILASSLSEGASCAFNESATLTLNGDLDTTALEKAFESLVSRHDALRSTFSEDGLSMRVHPTLEIPIEKIDLSNKGSEQLKGILHIDASTPYNLQEGPLLRPMLIKTSDKEHKFVISAHHLICDGWSYNVIAEELCELYNSFCQKVPHHLCLPKQYADHSREQIARQKGEAHQLQETYWLNQFKSLPDPLELPLDRPYQIDRTFRGETIEHFINKAKYEEIKKVGAKMGSTLYSTLAATFELLIHRLTGQDDIVVCIPAAGQNDGEDTDNLIGHCVNFLPLRSRYQHSDKFEDFLSQSRKTLLEATDNRSFTYGELIQRLDIERDPRRMPLLEVAFNCERMDYFGEWKDLCVKFEPNGKTHVHYPMFMNIVESQNGLRIDVDYNSDILDRDTVEGWLSGFETLIDGIIEDPKRSVSKLPIMDQACRKTVLQEWNSIGSNPPLPDSPVHKLFEEQVRLHPESTALTSSDGEISYQELNEQANTIADQLKKNGVSPDDIVAIVAERSAGVVAGLLGILKTGAAYLPIDPNLPQERISLILKDASPSVILSGTDTGVTIGKGTKALSIRDLLQKPMVGNFESYSGNLDDLAYVMYTSGSTGAPKGTLIPHRGIVRLVKSTDYMAFGPDEVFLLSAPLSFDASTLELYGPLLNGGSLALLDSATPGLDDIANAIREFGVTTLWLTSGLFNLMVEEHPDALKGLKQLLAGGDVLSKSHVAKALKLLGEKGTLINGYGPTENTTFTTAHKIVAADTTSVSIPIGRPIAHTQCYILDETLQPVRPGTKGRLYIGGDGLAIGYLNQTELTLKKFIPTPFSELSDERLYDSGDTCRWLKDGTIEFVGRSDKQVKLRGFRIELDEIENILTRHDEVSQAVTVIAGQTAAEKQLISFIVPERNASPKPEDLRKYLNRILPDYMVPSDFVITKELPVTTNGKIDEKALLGSYQPKTTDLSPGIELPTTDTEIKLIELWSEILGHQEIGTTDNFFQIGGNSLSGLKMFTRIHKMFDVNFPLAKLFQAPTIKQLAEAIETNTIDKKIEIVTKVSSGNDDQTPLVLLHGGNGGTLFYKTFIENIESYRDIYTVEAPMAVDRTLVQTGKTIEETAAEYIEQIREEVDGRDLAIGGYSFGGVLAYEIARQLKSSDLKVERLFLFDTNNPATEEDYKNGISTVITSEWNQIEADNILDKISKVGHRIGTKLQDRTHLRQTRNTIREIQETSGVLEDDVRMTAITEMHNEMMLKYQPKPYDGETHLFRAKSSRYSFDREMGWKGIITNLSVHDITGRHLEIFDSPNVESLIHRFDKIFSLYA
ncbi:MAG: amino acid adenylation domain-containing protein [Verrucomicrobiales bacterium]|nr:amino acid adenylation domain-containing protein [Verrucomicrobiales bacterium]